MKEQKREKAEKGGSLALNGYLVRKVEIEEA